MKNTIFHQWLLAVKLWSSFSLNQASKISVADIEKAIIKSSLKMFPKYWQVYGNCYNIKRYFVKRLIAECFFFRSRRTLLTTRRKNPAFWISIGVRMVPFNLKVLEKYGLCSNCSQKLHGYSLARARKIFATARMLAFSLTCARLLEISLILLCSYFLYICKR